MTNPPDTVADREQVIERKPSPDPIEVRSRTDVANAKRFAAMYRDDAKWCEPWGKWLTWDGARWEVDDKRRVVAMAKKSNAVLWSHLEKAAGVSEANAKQLLQFAIKSDSKNGIDATLTLAKDEPGIPVLPSELDSDRWAFNVINGTIDLRTGELRPHNRADLITKQAPVAFDADAEASTWEWFVNDIMRGDIELCGYLRRLVGYSLSGSVEEHILPICYGNGCNGKSVFLNCLLELCGAYGMKASHTLLMSGRDSHPVEVAELAGRRFVAAIETPEGSRLAESLVKELTGGDRIQARRLYENPWQFDPQHTIWLATNHRPQVRGTDKGIWRRLRLIPFTQVIPESRQDRGLQNRLMGELPGILNWALRGLREWQADGLGEPTAVKSATDDYRDDENVVAQFVHDACEQTEGAAVQSSELYRRFKEWCDQNGERSGNYVSNKKFSGMVEELGFVKQRTRAGIMFDCLQLIHRENEW